MPGIGPRDIVRSCRTRSCLHKWVATCLLHIHTDDQLSCPAAEVCTSIVHPVAFRLQCSCCWQPLLWPRASGACLGNLDPALAQLS